MTARNTILGRQHLEVVKYGDAVAATPGAYKALSAVAMNGDAATRTITLDTRNMAKVILKCVFTRSSGTDVQIAPYGSLDGGTTYGNITQSDISTGTGAIYAFTDVRTTSSTENFCVEYDVRGYDFMKYVFASTSAGAGDTLTVYAVGVVGQ